MFTHLLLEAEILRHCEAACDKARSLFHTFNPHRGHPLMGLILPRLVRGEELVCLMRISSLLYILSHCSSWTEAWETVMDFCDRFRPPAPEEEDLLGPEP